MMSVKRVGNYLGVQIAFRDERPERLADVVDAAAVEFDSECLAGATPPPQMGQQPRRQRDWRLSLFRCRLGRCLTCPDAALKIDEPVIRVANE